MEKILKKEVYELLGENYIDYAMSVITSRALPSVKDGLKPVHRRILYSMNIDGNNNNRSYKKSARAVGNCFIEDTLVATQNGLLPIKDLKVGDEVITHNGVEKVTKLYVMPEQELLKINLSNGLSNISTIGQMYKVLDKKLQYKWVEAKDLSIGDYVVCKSGKRHDTEYQTSNEIVINEDIAYFLGFFLADGYIDRDKKRGYHRIGMTCRAEKKKPVIDKIKNIIEENFNISINITNGGSNGYGFRINNVDTNTKIIKAFDLSNKYAHNITIPKEIFKSNENVKMAFVSGFLDGDGHVREGKNCIVFSSISEKFLSEMNILLFDMGYCGGKYNQITNIEHSVLHTLEYSSVYYEKMIKKLNLLNSVSCDNLEVGNINSSSHDKIPYLGQLVLQEFSEKHLGGGWYRASSGKKIRSGIKYKNGCKIRYGKDLKERFNIYKSNLKSMGILNKMQLTDSKYLEFVNDVMSNDLTFCKVKSIEKRESEVTYDIQVENAHEFIANGMIVHNCMGVFHPHGDSSIYEAMVNLAQDFSTRYPLIDMHGNVGSLDGDPAAAMRYTESRLTAIADEAMRDIEKNTVAMTNNFDGTVLEPTALPTLLPLIFMNGE